MRNTPQGDGGPTIEGIEVAVCELKAVGGRPTTVFVRRDAWPAFKAELESKCNEANTVDVSGPFGPALIMGIPIHVVDYLPRPWMLFPDDLVTTPSPPDAGRGGKEEG